MVGFDMVKGDINQEEIKAYFQNPDHRKPRANKQGDDGLHQRLGLKNFPNNQNRPTCTSFLSRSRALDGTRGACSPHLKKSGRLTKKLTHFLKSLQSHTMGISRDSMHGRRHTGGKRKSIRKKRKFMMARPPSHTKIGPKRIHACVVASNSSFHAP